MADEPKENIGVICNIHADERHAKWQAENKDTKIQVGDFCKLGFIIEKGSPKKEHMWVRITKLLPDDTYESTLENDPVKVKDIKFGDAVIFSRSEICQHMEEGYL